MTDYLIRRLLIAVPTLVGIGLLAGFFRPAEAPFDGCLASAFEAAVSAAPDATGCGPA